MAQNVIESGIINTLKKNYMPYTSHVILERALPEIDGLKPSQRRILYTMMKMGLLNGARKKSQGIVGQTMFFHPHGDQTIYETLVRMSKDAEALLLPYIDSKGNFGKQSSRDTKYASARYTEVRLTKVMKEFFKDIDKNTVDMIDNYDGTLKEPRLLPVTFPSILTNSQSGTAVGMANNFASFNLGEVIDYTIAHIKNPKAIVSDFIKAPDMSTGGSIIYDKEVFDNIFNTGRGSFLIRANYRLEKNSIIFYEAPYNTTFEAITDKIVSLVKDGKLKEIVDVDDIDGINSKGIEITVKNNTNKELLIEKLFKTTPLQSSFGCNFNMVVNGKPQVLGVKQIVNEWLIFRAKSILRGAEFELNKSKGRLNFLNALKKVVLNIDETIAIIRNTKVNSQVVNNLVKSLEVDAETAESIADIKLKHLNVEYLANRIKEIEVIEKEIKSLEDLISNKLTLAKLIISQLQEVKKNYSIERKSQIIEVNQFTESESEAIEIDDYNVRVFVTKEGYLKKIPLTSLRGAYTIRVKDGDRIVGDFEATNTSEILIFTDKQNVYKYKAHEIENHKPSDLGEYISTMLKLEDEEVLFTTVTGSHEGHLVIGFEDGRFAKIDLSAYATKQNRTMLKNAYADKKAIYWNVIHEDVDILCISSIDKALVFNTSSIDSKSSRTVQGNIVMRSKNDSTVKRYLTVGVGDVVREEVGYYRIASAGVGKYLKDGDFSDLLNN